MIYTKGIKKEIKIIPPQMKHEPEARLLKTEYGLLLSCLFCAWTL
jgi:hypothetical protein